MGTGVSILRSVPNTSPEEASVSTDSNGREPDKSPTDTEGVMFPSNPIWERGKRRGARGRHSEPETLEPIGHEERDGLAAP